MKNVDVRWKRRDGALSYHWEAGSKPTAMFVADCFENIRTYTGKTLVQELQDRGYDVTTLRFSIKKKQPAPESKL